MLYDYRSLQLELQFESYGLFFFFNDQKLIHHYASKGSTRLQSLLFIETIVIQNMNQYVGPLIPNLRWSTGSPDEIYRKWDEST